MPQKNRAAPSNRSNSAGGIPTEYSAVDYLYSRPRAKSRLWTFSDNHSASEINTVETQGRVVDISDLCGRCSERRCGKFLLKTPDGKWPWTNSPKLPHACKRKY